MIILIVVVAIDQTVVVGYKQQKIYFIVSKINEGEYVPETLLLRVRF